MRYPILLSFTVFIFGPLLAWIMESQDLSFSSPVLYLLFFGLSFAAFILLQCMCAFAVERYPKLVKRTLITMFVVLLLLIPLVVM